MVADEDGGAVNGEGGEEVRGSFSGASPPAMLSKMESRNSMSLEDVQPSSPVSQVNDRRNSSRESVRRSLSGNISPATGGGGELQASSALLQVTREGGEGGASSGWVGGSSSCARSRPHTQPPHLIPLAPLANSRLPRAAFHSHSRRFPLAPPAYRFPLAPPTRARPPLPTRTTWAPSHSHPRAPAAACPCHRRRRLSSPPPHTHIAIPSHPARSTHNFTHPPSLPASLASCAVTPPFRVHTLP